MTEIILAGLISCAEQVCVYSDSGQDKLCNCIFILNILCKSILCLQKALLEGKNK